MHSDVGVGGSGGQMSPPPSAAAPSIGVNLRVTGHCSQGGRKYMEDFFSVAYHQSENTKDLEYAFVGIYDGHGGSEAATFAKEHLMMEIINQKLFWSDCDQDVLRAIREGYIATHYAMWREQEKWPKTATGLPSTAGTTATVAFIRHEKIYIGHVGDSGIVLGYQNPDETFWRAKQLTQDHKPESAVEKARIINSGGKVVVKSGVPRVVWNRPRTGHKGPVRRSTPIDEIPFLAVARSLGDLWSYNSALNEFVVSPDPDVKVIKINPKTFRCLIFGTDGLWNVISPSDAVDTVHEKEIINERLIKMRGENNAWCNPSKGLVEIALKTWSSKKMRADNTSVVTVILYPPEGTATKDNPINDYTSTYGLNYIKINSDINYSPTPQQNSVQKFLPPNPLYEPEPQLYEMESFNQSHQLPHYETIAPSSAMRFHLQQHQLHQSGYMPSYLDRDDGFYTNNFETNCDTPGYLYSEDQTSNTYINSFAESYNSLFTSNLEREDNSLSNGSSGLSRSSDESDDSTLSNASDYHSYHSLHNTGLAGHDRVHHHFPNNEHQIEQLMYQEQCMSAEEGYSLTKLETRGEQQLRSNINEQGISNCETFQIFGSDARNGTEAVYNQYSNISSSLPKSFNNSESSNSNFLSSYEDNARSYEPNMVVNTFEEPAISAERTTSLCIERLDDFDVDRLAVDTAQEVDNSESLIEIEMEVLEVENCSENPDESIQINEITSSVIEKPPPPPEPPQLCEHEIQKPTKILSPLSAIISESVMDTTTPLKKAQIPKLVLYPNVPNENHRTPRRPSVQHNPRIFEKRMLRSMTVDYSKRTLRSRNSLSKDMKAKIPASANIRRSNIIQNKFIKAIQTSSNEENSSVISRKSLNLRSREITTTTDIWSASESSVANQRQQRKSKPTSLCDNSVSSKETTSRNRTSSTHQLTPVAVKIASVNSAYNHHAQQQVTMSFAKRSSLRNSGWGSAKTTMQTRNRVQKRLSR